MKSKLVLICMISAITAFSQNPAPPPPSTETEEEIFVVVEDIPLFSGCDDIKAKDKKRICAEEKMLDFVYENLIYPEAAQKESIEGAVVVQFVVTKDGNISNAVIIRDIGGGCGAEALRIVESMPKWDPGKQRGVPVNVRFTLPIRFKLDKEEK